MPVSHKRPPRFIPTLTEVVVPTDAAAPAVVRKQEPVRSRKSAARTPVADEVVERVMQRLEPLLERQLRELIAPVVQQQLDMLEQRLAQDIRQVVHQAVAKAMAPGPNSTRRH